MHSADRNLHEATFRAMGCQMALVVATEDAQAAAVHLAAARSLIDGLEDRLSRFRTTSELSHLNAHPARSMPVSEDLWEVLQLAIDGARRTGGLYDPTILDALESVGYDRPFQEMRGENGPLRRLTSRPDSWREIRLDSRARTVTLPSGARLDFGGIAKAWTAERAATSLSALGPCLVDAGGDIATRGAPPGRPGWPIGVADPRHPDRDLTTLVVAHRGVATSGVDFRRWRRDGTVYHHIIDPRTHLPARTDLWSVTVVAANAREANLHAITALILGSKEGLRYLAAQYDIEGLAVDQEGGVRTTPGFCRQVWSKWIAGGVTDG